MLSDHEIAMMSKASSCETLLQEMENEIARLRAENEQLRATLAAKTLRPETVRVLRKTLLNCGDWNAGAESLADLDRAYHEEV